MSYSSINLATKPIVLSISGHDPSGGAGIQADIEVLNHFDCHPCSIITCLTVQDSSTVHRLIPQEAEAIVEQASILFNDMPINAIKIGLTGSLGAVNAIASIIKSQPNIPIVFDPVLACGDGTPLANADLIGEIKSKLLPLTTVLRNHLFNNNEKLASYEWQRQAGHFHGTGCTLASAIAALIATGQSIPDAIELAQTYVDNTIKQAIQLGKGQRFLHRSQA